MRLDRRETYYWHVHHEMLFEPVVYSIINRIKYIEEGKPVRERGLRLKLLRPLELPPKKGFSRYVEVDIHKLHKEQCIPNCPWIPNKEDGLLSITGTIFNYRTPSGYWTTKDRGTRASFKDPINFSSLRLLRV